MIPRAQDVGDMVINRLESGISDLPFFIVLCLGNVSHMNRHDDVPLLLVLLNPLGLFKEAGTLITNTRPMLLCLLMPDISVALRIRQNDQCKESRILLGFLLNTIGRLFRSHCFGEEKKKKRGNNIFHDPHSPKGNPCMFHGMFLAFTVLFIEFYPTGEALARLR